MALDINYDYLNVITTVVFIFLAPLLVYMGVFQAQGGEKFVRRSQRLDWLVAGLLILFLLLIGLRVIIIAELPG